MSAPSLPPDNSAQIRQMELDAAERQRQQEAEAAATRKQELAQLRTNAASTGRTTAQDYFSTRGVSPDNYASTINDRINAVLGGISPEDPNPGSYFTDIGPTIYDYAQTGERAKYGRDVDRIFAPDFETTRIPYTLDDPYLASIEAEQRASADEIVRNMLDRGVITPAGYSAAEADLKRQAPGVRSRLNEVGTNVLTGGQQSLRDVANEARSTASTLELGTPFDPYSYGSRADQTFNDFISRLGDTIRAQAPGDLFTTTGLAAIAGAGQGAQNTVFDPAALSGIIEPESDEDKKKSTGTSIF